MQEYKITEEEKKRNNKLIGKLFLENSSIVMKGNNNILYASCTKLKNSSIEFRGDNCIVYICKTSDILTIDLKLYNNSCFYLGLESWINKGIKIVISEETNVFFGNESLISYDTCIRTADPHIIYDINTHSRINMSKSIYIGDHVWIGQDVMILKGTTIGSGTIIGAKSLVANSTLKSNCIYAGSPAKLIKKDVYFLRDNCHNWISEDTINNSKNYQTDYIYESDNNTISFTEIEKNLKNKNIEERLEYLKELTNNNSKNRFYY